MMFLFLYFYFKKKIHITTMASSICAKLQINELFSSVFFFYKNIHHIYFIIEYLLFLRALIKRSKFDMEVGSWNYQLWKLARQ